MCPRLKVSIALATLVNKYLRIYFNAYKTPRKIEQLITLKKIPKCVGIKRAWIRRPQGETLGQPNNR